MHGTTDVTAASAADMLGHGAAADGQCRHATANGQREFTEIHCILHKITKP
jgi:hypothetical protein